MKVAMICGEYPPNSGGVGQYVYHLSRELTRAGIDVVVTTRGEGNPSSESADTKLTVTRVFVPSLPPLDLAMLRFAMRRSLNRSLASIDLVHYHTPVVPHLGIKKPSLSTVHGTVRGALESDLRGALRLIKPVVDAVYVRNERKVLAGSDMIAAVSEGTRRAVVESYNLRSKRMVVAYNGVDVDYFRQSSTNDKTEKLLLFAGALRPRKGVDVLLDALSSLASSGRTIPKTVIVGRGPLQNWTNREIGRRHLSDKVQVKGFVTREELRQLYSSALAYVSPSRHEGFPTTVLEAMASGTAVITSDIPGTDELVSHGMDGIRFPVGSSDALADAIERLCTNEKEAYLMGRRGREKVERLYSWNTIAAKYVELYSCLLDESFDAHEMVV